MEHTKQGTLVESNFNDRSEASEPHSTAIPWADESSLAEESSAILDYRIGIIQTTIQKARTISDDTRAELLTLVTGLKSELAILSKTHHEEASNITRFADVSAHEKPFLLLVVGNLAADAGVPDIARKSLDEIASFVL